MRWVVYTNKMDIGIVRLLEQDHEETHVASSDHLDASAAKDLGARLSRVTNLPVMYVNESDTVW